MSRAFPPWHFVAGRSSVATRCWPSDLARPAENVGIRYLVENLSRITGHTTAGDPVELRLHGLTDAPEVARRSFRTEWVGSLPWAPSIAQLADSPRDRLPRRPYRGRRAQPILKENSTWQEIPHSP